MNKIELEYRTEIPFDSFEQIRDKFTKELQEVSHTKRLSYMGFTDAGDDSIDLRARVTNGESEVVLKKGGWHSSDRVEIPQPVEKDQLLGFAKIFANIAERNFISERETYNYEGEEGIVVSLVRSSTIAYVEFELLSDENEVTENDKKVRAIMERFGFKPMSKEEFDSLNTRLEEQDDWEFSDSASDVSRLEELLSNY